MKSKRHIINLNIDAPGNATPILSAPVLIPPSQFITIQLLFKLFDFDPVSVKFLQSTDGIHFDYIYNSSAEVVTLLLTQANTSATINLVNLATQWIRFEFQFGEDETGTINSANIITF